MNTTGKAVVHYNLFLLVGVTSNDRFEKIINI